MSQQATDSSPRTHDSLFLPPPSRPVTPRVNVHVRAGAGADIEPKSPYEIRVLEFHNLYCEAHHPSIHRREFTVAIRVYHHVGGVAVLVLAVLRRALHAAVVLGSAESGVHIDVQIDLRAVAVPPRDLGNDELELVEKSRTHRRIPRPHVLLVVIQEVADAKVL